MKIPYVKLYTADLLAASRYLTSQQIGDGILALCESAFENDTAYTPDTAREQAFFNMLLNWKEESRQALETNKKKMKKARSMRWQKKQNIVGQSLQKATQATLPQHTETEPDTETKTETEPETENINIFTAQPRAAQSNPNLSPAKKLPLPAEFVDQVIERFEKPIETDTQKHIFLKRNARCLKDILDFCDHDIMLALQTISVCARRLQQAGFSGGYEAVCRHLPEYYDKAKKELTEQDYD